MLVLFGACLILYFGVFDYAAKWVEYDSLEFLSQQFGFDLTYEIQDLGVTVRLTNIKDTFLLLQNTGLDPVLLNATSEGFAKSSVALVGFLVLLVAGFILSTILYWIILKWIMPKRLRKGFVARLFGGIFGMIEMGTICVIFFQFSGNLAIPLDSVILPQLQDNQVIDLQHQYLMTLLTDGRLEDVVLNHKTYHILRYNAENISEHVHALLFMNKLYENIIIIDNKYTYTHLYILLHHILKY